MCPITMGHKYPILILISFNIAWGVHHVRLSHILIVNVTRISIRLRIMLALDNGKTRYIRCH